MANKSSIPFTKVQALGNDFIIVESKNINSLAVSPSQLAKSLCDRHFGIGADGLVLIKEADRQDCHLAWSFINSDGSNSAMCGNAIRCLALWAANKKIIAENKLYVSTDKGKVEVIIENPDLITSDLGEPILLSTQIPVSGKERKEVVREKILVDGQELSVTCVSMGNPHCVVFDSPLSSTEQLAISPSIQKHSFFPEGVNVEFTQIEDRNNAKVFVFERGCGPTLACASGAAAVIVAGVLEKRLDRNAYIKLPGGILSVTWREADNHVLITGPAREIYQGNFDSFALINGSNGKKRHEGKS